jgi:PAS domain S-box-containing protein
VARYPQSEQRVAIDLARYWDPILDSITDGVFTINLDWEITSFNRAAENITGMRREQAIGHRCSEVFRANICQDACVMQGVLTTGEPAVNASVFVVDACGACIPIKVSAAVLHLPWLMVGHSYWMRSVTYRPPHPQTTTSVGNWGDNECIEEVGRVACSAPYRQRQKPHSRRRLQRPSPTLQSPNSISSHVRTVVRPARARVVGWHRRGTPREGLGDGGRRTVPHPRSSCASGKPRPAGHR